MILGKVKACALALAATASVVAVPTLVARQGPPAKPTKPTPPSASPTLSPVVPNLAAPGDPAAPGDSPAALHVQLAARVVKAIDADGVDNSPEADEFRFHWYDRLAQAELDASLNRVERIKALQAHVDRHRRVTAERSKRLAARFTQVRNLAKLGPRTNDPADRAEKTREVDDLWVEATRINAPLEAAQQWLARVEAEPAPPAPADKPAAAQASAPAASTTKPSTALPEMPNRQLKIPPDPRDEEGNRRILAKLDERISMTFPNDTPLEDVLKYVAQSTQDEAAGLPTGIPIYVDPRSLKAGGNKISSTVALSLEGVPLRTTLRLLLDQLKLTYVVEGGVLMVLSTDPARREPPPQGGFQ